MSAFDVLVKTTMNKAVELPEMRITANVKVGSFQLNNKVVLALTERENYVDDMFPTATITIQMLPSEYNKIVLYGHEEMSVFVRWVPYHGGKERVKVFRAVLSDWKDVRGEGNIKGLSDARSIDDQNFNLVDFELYDYASYELRQYEFGRTFQYCTGINALKYLLSQCMLKDYYNDESYVATINADQYALDKKYTTLTIRDGTSIFSIVDYIQDRYGIYNQGIGCFLKRNNWFIYAPYSVRKYEENVNKLTIINIPSKELRGVSKNFVMEGKSTTILSTGETTITSNSDKDALNGGVGTRYADTNQLLEMSTPDPTNLTPKMRPENYMSEFIGVKYRNKLKYVPTAKGGFVSNPAKELSKLAARGGRYVNTVWEHGTMDLLYPNMPVKFITETDGKIKEYRGTLLAATALSTTTGGMIDMRMQTNIVLSLFLKDPLII